MKVTEDPIAHGAWLWRGLPSPGWAFHQPCRERHGNRSLPPLERCGKPTALVDGPLGVEFGRHVGPADDVDAGRDPVQGAE